MVSDRARHGIRIALLTRTCGICPVATAWYTIDVLTRRIAASSRTETHRTDSASTAPDCAKDVPSGREKPPVWRRLRVAGDLTLRDLHHVLQISLGWTDSHLHEFEISGTRYGLPDPDENFSEPALDEQLFPLHGVLARMLLQRRY
jgi:Plasmid pRiA4b ORF-3-like protein